MFKTQRIRVSVVINNKVHNEEVLEIMKFAEFKKMVIDKYSIKKSYLIPNDTVSSNSNIYNQYSFYYNNVKIPDYFNSSVGELFKYSKEDETPVIIAKSNTESSNNQVKCKKSSSPTKNNYEKINNNKVNHDLDKKRNNNNNQVGLDGLLNNPTNSNNNLDEKDLITKVSITSFPSRTEVFLLVDKFLEAHNLSKQYFSENRENEIIVKFDSSTIAFDFIKFVNNIKSQSGLYQKMKTSMYIGVQKRVVQSNGHIKDCINKLHHPSNNNLSFQEVNNNNIKFNKINKLINIAESNEEKHNYSNINNSIVNGNISNRNKGNNSFIHKHFTFERKPAFIRNLSPYKSEEDISNEEYKKNKQKWLVKKGFFKNVHNIQEDNFIKNFVNVSQYKGSYKNYNFREVSKNKWVNNKDFEIY
jgi:hypothetical protein